MQMTHCAMVLAGALLMLALGGASAERKTDEIYYHHGFHYVKPAIEAPAVEEFLIMPWGWTPGDAQALKDIKDCGFNIAGFVAPEHVKLVERAGIKCIVDDPRISEVLHTPGITDEEIGRRVAESTSKFKDNKAVYGYYVMDEPIAPLFPGLARWADAIRKADPDATPYINLLPIGAQGPGSKDYEDYIEQFVKVIRPTYISYDHYTLMDDGSVRPSLYMNLDVMRKASQRHRIPFWNIVLANSHFHYADVTQGGLNLQVYATLAYGGRGISYFTYFAPFVGNYRNAAVDQFLNKTPTWDMLRNINLQIHRLAPVYLKLRSVNVFHHPNVPQGGLGMDATKYLAEVSGGDLLVGEFEGPDRTPFVLVVNKDIHKSTSFHVKFKGDGQIMQTNAYTGKTQPWGGENGWLSPGQGMLLSLQR